METIIVLISMGVFTSLLLYSAFRLGKLNVEMKRTKCKILDSMRDRK